MIWGAHFLCVRRNCCDFVARIRFTVFDISNEQQVERKVRHFEACFPRSFSLSTLSNRVDSNPLVYPTPRICSIPGACVALSLYPAAGKGHRKVKKTACKDAVETFSPVFIRETILLEKRIQDLTDFYRPTEQRFSLWNVVVIYPSAGMLSKCFET